MSDNEKRKKRKKNKQKSIIQPTIYILL